MHFFRLSAFVALSFSLVSIALGQTPTPTPTPEVVGEVTVTTKFANSDPLYQKLRQNLELRKVSSDCFQVNNLTIQKDKGTFLLKSGEFYFLEPIDGRVTAGVFMGDGEFSMIPPVEYEKKHLSIFTGSPDIKEDLTEIILYFTDKTFDEIKASPNARMTAGCSRMGEASSALKEKGNILKRQFRFNMASRILGDFLTPKRPGFFTSFIEGKRFGKLLYQIDPMAIPQVYPEQVALSSYSDKDFGIWAAFYLADEYKKGTAKSWMDRRNYDIIQHDIEMTVQGTKMIGKDTITLQSLDQDLRFFAFELFDRLRVKTVTNENGEELSFIQEKRGEDADFGLILEKAPNVNTPFKIVVEYEGDGALISAGSGNFFLGPRSTWYPNNPFAAFADRAKFNLTMKYPKKFTMVGIGDRVGEVVDEGEIRTSKWTTGDVEFEVAGFNYGDFKSSIFKDAASGYSLEVFANSEMPDFIKDFQNQIDRAESSGQDTFTNVRTLNTIDGINKVMIEAQNSVRLYNAFFGKLPYNRIAMTQQPAGNFGQAWTTLIFMPFVAYIPEAQRVQIFGIRGGTSEFWTKVGPHEVAHQWWGHIVGWTSYRDQWMSEGFSELSASLYVQYVDKDINKFITYWEEQRKLITEASASTKGLKPYTVGPLTQGGRLNSGKAGNVYRRMIYPKGAYVLHMLRMMMYDHGKTGDARFKAMMQDFIKRNYNKPVSTEDFQRAVERHITPEMDIDKNKKMNWFFDEWVYGTEMPSYKLEYQVNGTALTGKITQSGVTPNFVMSVPFYADFGSGWQYIASVSLAGNDSLDLGTINLPRAPKKVAIAALNDVLAEKIENIKK